MSHTGDRGARRVADLRVRPVSGAGHLLPIERPHLVAEAVAEVGSASH